MTISFMSGVVFREQISERKVRCMTHCSQPIWLFFSLNEHAFGCFVSSFASARTVFVFVPPECCYTVKCISVKTGTWLSTCFLPRHIVFQLTTKKTSVSLVFLFTLRKKLMHNLNGCSSEVPCATRYFRIEAQLWWVTESDSGWCYSGYIWCHTV